MNYGFTVSQLHTIMCNTQNCNVVILGCYTYFDQLPLWFWRLQSDAETCANQSIKQFPRMFTANVCRTPVYLAPHRGLAPTAMSETRRLTSGCPDRSPRLPRTASTRTTSSLASSSHSYLHPAPARLAGASAAPAAAAPGAASRSAASYSSPPCMVWDMQLK